MSSSAGTDWSAITREILDSIDIASEYERMGVRFASQKVTSRGWRECYAAGRDESSPSAAVNLGHGKLRGRYKDQGGSGLSCSFFEFASNFGGFADWKDARAWYAERCGIEIPGVQSSESSEELAKRRAENRQRMEQQRAAAAAERARLKELGQDDDEWEWVDDDGEDGGDSGDGGDADGSSQGNATSEELADVIASELTGDPTDAANQALFPAGQKLAAPEKRKKRRRKPLSRKFVQEPWNESLAYWWTTHHKQGIATDSIRSAGGIMARWPKRQDGSSRGQHPVFAIPFYGAKLLNDQPVGWVMLHRSGQGLPIMQGKGNPPIYRKIKNLQGSSAGWIGKSGLERLPEAKYVWLVEGPTDWLAMESIIPEEMRQWHAVLSNSNGASERPKEEMIRVLAGKIVFVIRDCDHAGQGIHESGNGGSSNEYLSGAPLWASEIARHATESRNVVLPYPIVEKHGKDLRDWVRDGGTFEQLFAMALTAPVVAPPVKSAILSEDGTPQTEWRADDEGDGDGDYDAAEDIGVSKKSELDELMEALCFGGEGEGEELATQQNNTIPPAGKNNATSNNSPPNKPPSKPTANGGDDGGWRDDNKNRKPHDELTRVQAKVEKYGFDSPTKRDSSLDTISEDVICELLGIDVLGEVAGGLVEIFSKFHRKSVRVDLNRLTVPLLYQVCGVPAREHINETEETIPDRYSLGQIRKALGMIAGYRQLRTEWKRGLGVWQGKASGAGGETEDIVLVNGGEAAQLSPDSSLKLLHSPRSDGLMLDIGRGDKWYEFEQLAHLIHRARTDREWVVSVINESISVFDRWCWKNQATDPTVVTGLIMATWIQSLWKWRPMVAVIGNSGAGKTTLFQVIGGSESSKGLFGALALVSSQSSEAGLRQAVKHDATVLLCDEFEDSRDRAKILNLLRTSSRGAKMHKGSANQSGESFGLQHIAWVAAIEVGLKREPDRNRFIMLELVAPPAERANKLQVPDEQWLMNHGQKMLAVALAYAGRSVKLAVELKATRVDGVDRRVIESYAVPAAVLSTCIGATKESAERLLRNILTGVEKTEQGRSDADDLFSDILSARINCGHGDIQSVSQIIGDTASYSRYSPQLESCGVGVVTKMGQENQLFIAHRMVVSHLLRSTEWANQSIEQILKRIPGAKVGRHRLGQAKQHPSGVFIPMEHIESKYLGGKAMENNGRAAETAEEFFEQFASGVDGRGWAATSERGGK